MVEILERPELILKPEEIDEERRPQLAFMLDIFQGKVWRLSEEALSDETGHTRLLLLVDTGGQYAFIEDTAASPEHGLEEGYRLLNLPEEALAHFTSLLAPPKRKESTGRPRKYTLAREGEEIFRQHTYEGASIKKLAKSYEMSPTTVQKLLNQFRLEAARKLVSGEWELSDTDGHYEQNLAVLKWAAEHSEGEEKQSFLALLPA